MHNTAMTLDLRYLPALIAERILASGRHLDTWELNSLREIYSLSELPELVREYLESHPKARRARPRKRRTTADYERYLDVLTTYQGLLLEEQSKGGKAPSERAIVRLKGKYRLASKERVPKDLSIWRNLMVVKQYLRGWVHTGKFDY